MKCCFQSCMVNYSATVLFLQGFSVVDYLVKSSLSYNRSMNIPLLFANIVCYKVFREHALACISLRIFAKKCISLIVEWYNNDQTNITRELKRQIWKLQSSTRTTTTIHPRTRLAVHKNRRQIH